MRHDGRASFLVGAVSRLRVGDALRCARLSSQVCNAPTAASRRASQSTNLTHSSHLAASRRMKLSHRCRRLRSWGASARTPARSNFKTKLWTARVHGSPRQREETLGGDLGIVSGNARGSTCIWLKKKWVVGLGVVSCEKKIGV
eukprot:733038-Prymnesium_polylepis.1